MVLLGKMDAAPQPHRDTGDKPGADHEPSERGADFS